MKCNVRPYDGNEPYIFFSYCHEDGEQIYPIIEQMIDDGYRIWYDDGLRPGDEWPERIARMLDGCALCVAALSQKFSESHNCKNELTFAINNQKPLLVIKLEDFPMSMGMRLQLANTQYIEKYRYDSESLFFEKLYSASLIKMEECRNQTEPSVQDETVLSVDEGQEQESIQDSRGLSQYALAPIVIQCSSGKFFEGSSPVSRVGRDPNKCDIYFPENHAIGRHHMDIISEDKKYYIVDKESANHTWVNGKRLDKGGRCEIGTFGEIKIANETLVIAFGESADFLREHKLLVWLQSKSTEESQYLQNDTFILGRGHAWSGGVLSEKHISRTHAILRITEKGCMLSDVSSFNQTWVNERRIPAKEEYLLADKDEIRVGGHGGEYFTVHMKTLEKAAYHKKL